MGHITVFRTERRRIRRWDILISEDEHPLYQGKGAPFIMRVGSEKGEELKDAILRAIEIFKTERIIRFGEITPFTVHHVTRFGINGNILKPISPETLGLEK